MGLPTFKSKIYRFFRFRGNRNLLIACVMFCILLWLTLWSNKKSTSDFNNDELLQKIQDFEDKMPNPDENLALMTRKTIEYPEEEEIKVFGELLDKEVREQGK